MAKGLDPNRLREYVMRRGGGAERELNARGGRIVRRAQQLTSNQMVNVQSGQLRSSIKHEIKHFPTTMSLYVGSNVEYAKYVHDGTSPHVIRARPGGVLAFPKGGRTVFATYVNHPGTSPRPFLTTAMRETR